MEPNNMNNMPGGMPGVGDSNIGGVTSQPRSEAAMEMQAAIVADQIANPVKQESQENLMVEAAKAQKENKNGGKGTLIAAVLFAILAAGGIGFGVWAMMDGNSKQDVLNTQINSLKKTNNDLMDQVAELNEKITKLQSEAVNNNGNGSTIPENNTNTPISVTAEVLDGIFYVKDENGVIVAQDDARTVLEVISCEGGQSSVSPLKCSVTTSEGQGTYVYDLNERTLAFTLVQKPEEE